MLANTLESASYPLLSGGRRLAGKTASERYLLSIITVVKNAASDLKKTLECVREQAPGIIEHIVIDGGSADDTLDVLRQNNEWIEYWKSEPDSGLYDAMNKGVACAKGDWILFLNAGDTITANSFAEKIADDLRKSTDSLLLVPVQVIDARGTRPYKGRSVTSRGMPYCHQGMIVKRSSFDLSGGFLLEYKISADYEWLLRFLKAAQLNWVKIQMLNAPPIEYDNRGLSNKRFALREKESRAIVLKYCGFGIPYFVYCANSFLKVIAKGLLRFFKNH